MHTLYVIILNGDNGLLFRSTFDPNLKPLVEELKICKVRYVIYRAACKIQNRQLAIMQIFILSKYCITFKKCPDVY